MQKLFTKSLSRSLDPKGRLMLPAEYRDALIQGDGTGTFWLTCSFDHLVAYLPADWEVFTEQLNRIRFPSRQLSHFKTKIIGLAQDLIPDAQGRVRIPQSLMREAGLQKDVMLVGMHSNFQLWDQNRFDALTFGDISEELAAAGVDIAPLL
ncbi:division/cell wall cluster transcriptional repressor MraZ [Candidatus Desulfovibrio trichonymphae]|uniref:Transcriptional regulator MraZ n=1 Tax=Candidatus Desulfovibrio trichonymphae TaxID=1725232 RepID=A0A1J1DXQ3_9BACT|nr:cell division protein MraZ [Candidatus Desulfovibrio trichonymphae]GHU92047.1 transcriptional regulator MraZ [Deltaproteobacteria bacterium]GHU95899.1 transcriptional regulator MraZ [Deltaproteobacteria bacterium]